MSNPSKIPNSSPKESGERARRLAEANELLRVIASCGRGFFRHGENVARLELRRGRVYFIDQYTGRAVYTHYAGRWRGFTGGGTLRGLVERLQRYVSRGQKLPSGVFGPWPEWYCNGDLWGYGADMVTVREEAKGMTENGASANERDIAPVREAEALLREGGT